MSGIGESRSELLAWVNDLLQLDVKRVEECGTGAVYCQIMDSIFLDVPMHRVRFDVSQEYEYYTNYKILQSCFARHKIEKIVYVEKLVKCRFQDNLEFLQWIKKYWMQHKDSNPYDPLQGRRSTRQVSGGSRSTINGNASTINNNTRSRDRTPSAGNSLNVTRRRPMAGQSNSSISSSINNNSNNNSQTSLRSNYGNRRISNEQVSSLQTDLARAQEKIVGLNSEIDQFKDTTNILEREREFYFGKLRDIEILVQSTQDLIKEGLYNSNGTDELTKFLNRVQQILYATEDSYDDAGPSNPTNNDEPVQGGNTYQDDTTNHTIENNIPIQDNNTLSINDIQQNNNTNNNIRGNFSLPSNNDPITNNINNNNNLIIDEETF